MREAFEHLGFTRYESKVLEYLLRKDASLKDLSKYAKIPFGKVYSVVKSLKDRGFVKETNTRPKLVYVDRLSEQISLLIDERKLKEKAMLDLLKNAVVARERKSFEQTKFFDLGTTNDDNKRIQLRSFDEAKSEVLQIINIHHKPSSNRKNKSLWEQAISRAIARGVSFKAVYPVSTVLPKRIARLNQESPEHFSIRRRDTSFVRCDIIDGKKVLLKLVHEDASMFGGVLFIEDELFAENLRDIFFELYNG